MLGTVNLHYLSILCLPCLDWILAHKKTHISTIWMQASPQSPRLADVTSPQADDGLAFTCLAGVKMAARHHLRTPCSTKEVYMNSHSVEHSEFQIRWFWKKNLDNGNVEMTLVMKWGQHQTWQLGLFGTSSKVAWVNNITELSAHPGNIHKIHAVHVLDMSWVICWTGTMPCFSNSCIRRAWCEWPSP